MNPPNRPLSDQNILRYVRQLNIPNFRGVFMRDNLPKSPYKNECGVINLDITSGSGTHWVA